MTYAKTNHPFAKSIDGLFNELFNELPSTFGKVLSEDVLHNPPVNITETNEQYNLQMQAPGFEKTNFSVKLDGTLLTISAEKAEEKTDETAKSIKKEFSTKSFKRSFNVNEKIDAANISAKYENGILLVTLPKKEEVKATPKEITIS